jgi:hypothetical protein
MNIPLDRLYHYIETLAEEVFKERVLIYRFFPHGSKNINDLELLKEITSWQEGILFPAIWCNDQEPLDYEFYLINLRVPVDNPLMSILKLINLIPRVNNLNYNQPSFWAKGLLLHSEQRSNNLEKYQTDNELIPVYYWSHAIIARDWFRFAQHSQQRKQVNKKFLIYNRAWSGTREYRLTFLDLLLQLGLELDCQTSIRPVEPELGIHYKTYQFKNPTWRPTRVLENFFPINTAPSHYSADFDIKDYESTDIEVVLETLFDDDRLHLTEKILRPIACAQPFILVSTHGSLEYLRSYGFKTFSDIWDEQYNLVEDPKERLIRIVDVMRHIANWSPEIRERKMAEAQVIVDYNKQHFFSKEFFDLVTNELKTNLKVAFEELNQCNNYQSWINRWQQLTAYPAVVEFLKSNQYNHLPTTQSVDYMMNLAHSRLTTVAKKNKI